MERTEFIEALKDLCNGPNMPDRRLYEAGELPEGWEQEFTELLSSNRVYWQNLDNWPKEVFYCFYRVAFHHQYAYEQWSRTNAPKEATELSLSKIRLLSESFICGSPNDNWGNQT